MSFLHPQNCYRTGDEKRNDTTTTSSVWDVVVAHVACFPEPLFSLSERVRLLRALSLLDRHAHTAVVKSAWIPLSKAATAIPQNERIVDERYYGGSDELLSLSETADLGACTDGSLVELASRYYNVDGTFLNVLELRRSFVPLVRAMRCANAVRGGVMRHLLRVRYAVNAARAVAVSFGEARFFYGLRITDLCDVPRIDGRRRGKKWRLEDVLDAAYAKYGSERRVKEVTEVANAKTERLRNARKVRKYRRETLMMYSVPNCRDALTRIAREYFALPRRFKDGRMLPPSLARGNVNAVVSCFMETKLNADTLYACIDAHNDGAGRHALAAHKKYVETGDLCAAYRFMEASDAFCRGAIPARWARLRDRGGIGADIPQSHQALARITDALGRVVFGNDD